MGLFFLLLLVFMPIAEIAVLIKVGGQIGVLPTVGLVVLTAVVGTALIRAQGLNALRRARESMDRGEMPLAEVFDGLCLVAAGALLLTPGFITDTMGFLLLLPPVRGLLKAWAATRLVAPGMDPTAPGDPRRGPDGTIIIEGEFAEVYDPHAKPDDAKSEGDGPPRIER